MQGNDRRFIVLPFLNTEAYLDRKVIHGHFPTDYGQIIWNKM